MSEIRTIVIKYPPDYDGELHVMVEVRGTAYVYQFTHAKMKIDGYAADEWDTLVKVARDIIAQANRRIKERYFLHCSGGRRFSTHDVIPHHCDEREIATILEKSDAGIGDQVNIPIYYGSGPLGNLCFKRVQ